MSVIGAQPRSVSTHRLDAPRLARLWQSFAGLSPLRDTPVARKGLALEQQLVAGRACGSCNVCCVALTIDEPALRKAQGYRCRNAKLDNSCSIYESRPKTCRAFYCGWRLLRWVRDSLRPDLSKVLVRLVEEPDGRGGNAHSVVFTLLAPAGLDAEGLAESVAAAIGAGIPTFLVVPGRPGFTAAQAQINELLEGAVRARDKAGLLALLREAHALGETGPRVRVRLRGR